MLKFIRYKHMPDIIEVNPEIMGGQPVIKGTRIPIARVMALIAHGYKLKDFKKDYPYVKLTSKNLQDILSFYQNQLV